MKKRTKIIGAVGIGLILIAYIFLFNPGQAWFNIGFAHASAVFYDENGNVISETPFFYLRTPTGEEIAGMGLIADIHFLEKTPGTVGTVEGIFEMDMRWVAFTDPYGIFQNLSFHFPFNWQSDPPLDWSDKIDTPFQWDSGQIWTWQQIEQEMETTIGSQLEGGVGQPSLHGTTFEIGLTIRLYIDSWGHDGQQFPRAQAYARGKLTVVYYQYDDPDQEGIIIQVFGLVGLDGGAGSYDDGGGDGGVTPPDCNPLIDPLCPRDLRG